MNPNPNVLLSDSLKDKVRGVVQGCLDIATEHYRREFTFPEIRYDIKNTDGGRALWPSLVIRLNLILLVENEEHFLKTTVPHEVAHLVARVLYHEELAAEGVKMRPHGKQWKEVMSVFEAQAKTTHNYDCTSIQKPKRNPRGSKLKGRDADLLILRLLSSMKRLPKRQLGVFVREAIVFYEEQA